MRRNSFLLVTVLFLTFIGQNGVKNAQSSVNYDMRLFFDTSGSDSEQKGVMIIDVNDASGGAPVDYFVGEFKYSDYNIYEKGDSYGGNDRYTYPSLHRANYVIIVQDMDGSSGDNWDLSLKMYKSGSFKVSYGVPFGEQSTDFKWVILEIYLNHGTGVYDIRRVCGKYYSNSVGTENSGYYWYNTDWKNKRFWLNDYLDDYYNAADDNIFEDLYSYSLPEPTFW